MADSPHSRVFVYPLSYDTGIAPNVAGGRLTLSCCMPDIRKQAVAGDWIIGTGCERHDKSIVKKYEGQLVPAAKVRSNMKVLYVGRVTAVLPWYEYSQRVKTDSEWAGKASSKGGDCIYTWNTSEPSVVLGRNPHLNGQWGNMPALAKTFVEDVSAPVLVCDEYSYIGDTFSEYPDMLGITKFTQEYMCDNLIRASPGVKTRTAFQVFGCTEDILNALQYQVQQHRGVCGKPCLGPYDIDLSETLKLEAPLLTPQYAEPSPKRART